MRRINCHRYVARGHQPHAACVNVSLDTCNRWLGALVNGAHHGCELPRICHVLLMAVVGHAAHPIQISPCAKRRPISGQHDAANVAALA